MGPWVTWQQSHVTDDKIYCVYIADSEKDVLEHAKGRLSGEQEVSKVHTVIDAATAE